MSHIACCTGVATCRPAFHITSPTPTLSTATADETACMRGSVKLRVVFQGDAADMQVWVPAERRSANTRLPIQDRMVESCLNWLNACKELYEADTVM